jgi:hypothetical protein
MFKTLNSVVSTTERKRKGGREGGRKGRREGGRERRRETYSSLVYNAQ